MGAINSTQPVGAVTEPFPRPVGASTSWAAHGTPSKTTTQATRITGARFLARLLNIRIIISVDIAIKRRAHGLPRLGARRFDLTRARLRERSGDCRCQGQDCNSL